MGEWQINDFYMSNFCLVKKTLVKNTRVNPTTVTAFMKKKSYLFHQTFVSSLSGPCLAMAALKFVALTDCSEFG